MITLFSFFGPELLVLFFGFLAIAVPVIIIVLIARYFKRRGNTRLEKMERETGQRDN